MLSKRVTFASLLTFFVLLSISHNLKIDWNLSQFQPKNWAADELAIHKRSELFLARNKSLSVAVIIGEEYSAEPCGLVPAWGSSTTSSSSGESVCVGRKPKAANTSATFLTCSDNKKPIVQQDKKTTNDANDNDDVTVALLYYAKPAMLLRQLEHFTSYPPDIRQRFTLLIIDDGSPAGLQAREYILVDEEQTEGNASNETATSPAGSYLSRLNIRLARITTDKKWNIGGARNLAFALADSSKVFMLDLDMIVPLKTFQALLTWQTRESTYNNSSTSSFIAHRFNRITAKGNEKTHPAVCVLDVAAYWGNGGCDEDFCGNYGFTDVHFWHRWELDSSRRRIDHADTYLVEVEQAACDEKYISNTTQRNHCQKVRANVDKKRKLKTNHVLFKKKIKEGCWSNQFLRFSWVIEK